MMEDFNESLKLMLQKRPRKKLLVMKALTFEWQNIRKIMFLSNETYSMVKRLLNVMEGLGYVEQYTKMVNYKLYRSYRWTQEGFKAYQILEQKHREQCRAMRKNHEAYGKTYTFGKKIPTLTDIKTPLVNVGVEK